MSVPVASLPSVIPGGAVVDEGDTGTNVLEVPVTLSNPTTETVTVRWTTIFDPAWSALTAEPGVDYEAADGTVTFAPGQTSQIVPIIINADTTAELDELVVVSFHDPVNAEVGGLGLGFGVIVDDDGP